MISYRTGAAICCAIVAAAGVAGCGSSGSGSKDSKKVAVTLVRRRLHPQPDQRRVRPGHVRHHQRRHLEGVRDGAQELLRDHPRRERERRRGRPGALLAQLEAGQLRRQLPQRRQGGPGQARLPPARPAVSRRAPRRRCCGPRPSATARTWSRRPPSCSATPGSSSPPSTAARWSGPRRCSAPRGSTTRRSSRSRRASATSTPRSTPGSTTSPTRSSGRAFTGSSRCCGQHNTTRGTEQYADKLMADVNTLSSKVQDIQLQPAQLANGAVELMNEVSNSKITGEEDRYSHTDLSDFQGNLSGSQKAFELLRPALSQTGNAKARGPRSTSASPRSRPTSTATSATPRSATRSTTI